MPLSTFVRRLRRIVTGQNSLPDRDPVSYQVINDKVKDVDVLASAACRHRPLSLTTLHEQTQFSKMELRLMYQGFKQDCPSGFLDEESFRDIFSQIFPHGDPSAYARHVFSSVNGDKTGFVAFDELVMCMSVLLRGSLEDKLHWTFTLYDVNGDGIISREEMTDIVSAIYDMLGPAVSPEVDNNTVTDHVERMFQRFDTSGKGYIGQEEFFSICQQDRDLEESVKVFDTILT